MATKVSADGVLADASLIINAWTANPDFKLGDLTLAKFKSNFDGLETANVSVETERTELTGLLPDRDDQAPALHELITRARSGFRAIYGPDSTQYEQAGGTRASERKRPVRKSKTVTVK